jgi:bifunctional non-homologous end joining protein LigD
MALMTPDAERRYVGSAFIGLNQAMRERLWQRAQDQHGPPAKGPKRKGETKWLKPGLVGRVRHLKGEQQLLHATLQDVREEG